MKHLAFVAFGVLLTLSNGLESYKDFKVYEVTPNEEQYEAFSEWQFENGVDFWRHYSAGVKSTVMIAPHRQQDFEEFLDASRITFNVVINDVEIVLEEERRNMTKSRRGKATALPGMRPDFSVYWSSMEMEQYCTYLANTYPQLVEMETLAFSPENRRIYAMKISSGDVFGEKPIIAMEAGMHAREWASPPTVLYLMHRVVENVFSRDEILSNVDFLIVPMTNPDGYEFSRTKNRLWRQNRRHITPICIGVDLNRNFEFSWRAPTSACGSLTYPGPSPLSEPESFELSQVVARHAQNVKLYLSVHTFGDMVLWPWGYAGSPGYTKTWKQHDALGKLWKNDILSKGGRSYIVGNVADVLGNAFGAVDDHMAGYLKIPYVYTIELTSKFQFIYPEERVEDLAFETFWGYRAMALEIGRQFGRK